MGPVQTIQTYDIKSGQTSQHYRPPTKLPPHGSTAGYTMTAGPARRSFVGGLHPLLDAGKGRQAMPERSNDEGNTVSVSTLLVLAASSKNHQRTIRTKS